MDVKQSAWTRVEGEPRQQGSYKARVIIRGQVFNFEGEYDLSKNAMVERTIESHIRGAIKIEIIST